MKNKIYHFGFRSRYLSQVGTPLYWAPETRGSECYTEAVDIWGLGTVFFSMLCGKKKYKEAFDLCEDKTLLYDKFYEALLSSELGFDDETTLALAGMLHSDKDCRPDIYEISQLLGL